MDTSRLALTDRVAVVTGAASGIGCGTALALADLGAHVAICDREADDLDTVAAEIRARDRSCVTEVFDVRDDDAVEAFMTTVDAELGPIDILVNNAGGGFWSTFAGVSASGEQALIRENFGTVSSCIRHAVPRMNNGAAIVNVNLGRGIPLGAGVRGLRGDEGRGAAVHADAGGRAGRAGDPGELRGARHDPDGR